MAKETQVPQPAQGAQVTPKNGLKISKLLKSARERSGKSIAEVAKITKINSDYIGYIENGETEMLPSNIFLKGYVSSIAKVLGVPPEEVKENFDFSSDNSPLVNDRTKGMDSEILLPTIGKSSRKSIIPTILLAVFSIGMLLFLSSYLIDITSESAEDLDGSEQPATVEEVAPSEDVKEFALPTKPEPAQQSETNSQASGAVVIGQDNKLLISLKEGPVEIAYRIDRKGEFETALVTSESSFTFKERFEVFCADFNRLKWVQNGVELTELKKGADNRFVFAPPENSTPEQEQETE